MNVPHCAYCPLPAAGPHDSHFLMVWNRVTTGYDPICIFCLKRHHSKDVRLVRLDDPDRWLPPPQAGAGRTG